MVLHLKDYYFLTESIKTKNRNNNVTFFETDFVFFEMFVIKISRWSRGLPLVLYWNGHITEHIQD